MAEVSPLRPRPTASCPAPKGGFHGWEQARRYPEVILVEGLFDYAVLWQAGFHHVTCSLGTHLNARQFRQPKPSPQTVNHRLGVVHCWYRFHYGREIPAGQSHFQRTYTKRSPLGYGRPRRAVALGLRLRQPRRVIVPLSAEDVARFWHSFRTFRDLALVGLMLLDGLRSCEVLALQLDDLQLPDAQMRVLGKGNKTRVLPLPPEIREVLEKYLRLDRPPTNSGSLFVSLKGRQRGRAMTPAGLRSLFRHHRRGSQVPLANAHRFRHFASEMVRLGVSLPALMQLLGHKDIRMTLRYVQVTQQDLQREFHSARQHAAQPHPVPVLSVPNCPTSANPPAIRQALAATRHLLEMYRRGLQDQQTRRQLQRLDRRLLAIADQLERITAEK